MATWQWFVLAIPALVLVVSIVMIIRLLLGATQSPADEQEAAAQPAREQPAEESDPVELGAPFDALFVGEDEVAPERAADDQYRRSVSPAEPETVVPRRVTESPS
ncbi:hypothetical protein CGZ94_11375 [Enemella evansiae]|uniref:Uncharacterized protein n=1 Tax=Enemella evansiae TaxID=2016499 RepID=A0A255GG97_9ACTN|nr:hypothetical protein [Enemella evansiae]OYO13556.1 hypothetical protein CGZ94_11375 [Enemella evansiae]